MDFVKAARLPLALLDSVVFSAKIGLKFFRMHVNPVKPTLRLSQEARNTSLPEGYLKDCRDLLTRTAKWKDLPTLSAEQFRSVPGFGVEPFPEVIGSEGPAFGSMGFGNMNLGNSEFSCNENTCESQHLTGSDEDWCVKNSCSDVSCEHFTCDDHTDGGCKTYDGDGPSCGKLKCGKQTEGLENFISEVELNWEHPFVQELRNYFQIDSSEDFVNELEHYTGRNMYDASALDDDDIEPN